MFKYQKGIGLIPLILIIVLVLIIGTISIFLVMNNDNDTESEGKEIGTKPSTNNKTQEENNNEEKDKNPYTLVINNVEYSFPVSYNKFSSNWSLNTELTTQQDFDKTVIKANENLYSKSRIAFKTNGIPLAFVYFINNKNDAEFKFLKDCDVFGLTYNDIFNKNNNDDGKWGYKITPGSVKIKNGNKEVVIGQSTKDEAISVLGQPFDTSIETEKYSQKQYSSLVWMDYTMNWRVELLTEPGGDDTIQYFTFHNSVY
ncbi:MAG: hypothetical protein E7310_08990 [Clostridiales bacterium]|nr:hypothetical protein [Clostridiales bacterium]